MLDSRQNYEATCILQLKHTCYINNFVTLAIKWTNCAKDFIASSVQEIYVWKLIEHLLYLSSMCEIFYHTKIWFCDYKTIYAKDFIASSIQEIYVWKLN